MKTTLKHTYKTDKNKERKHIKDSKKKQEQKIRF